MAADHQEDIVEIRNLRWYEYNRATRTAIFRSTDGSTHSLTMTRDDWKALGLPTYVVVSVRGETFAESTP